MLYFFVKLFFNSEPKQLMPDYHYKAFGLNICSSFECSEMATNTEQPADINFRLGNVPEHLSNCIIQETNYEVSSNSFLLKIQNIASYLIHNGAEIIVSPSIDANPDIVNLFLLGTAFGVLLFQRGTLPLHGSSISTPKGAVIFMGKSGFGKSTLAGAFYKRNYTIISDDVTAIINSQGIPLALPAYPRLLLLADAINKLDATSSDTPPKNARLDKFAYSIAQRFTHEPTPIHSIYVLNPSKELELNILPLSGFNKIQALINNTYRIQLIDKLGLTGSHFHQISNIANNARIMVVSRPANAYKLEELVDLLELNFS